jgi:membrane-associated phospholipid phosphatase
MSRITQLPSLPHSEIASVKGKSLPARKALIALACILLIVGCAALPFDIQISSIARGRKIPGDLNKAVQMGETFGHFSGAIAILSALLVIDLAHRKKLIQVAIFTTICGVTANMAKHVIPRYRPHSIDASPIPIINGWDTWGVAWSGSWFDESTRSFPSGHAATAVALAIGLMIVYPRGRWIFGVFAVVACLQRLVSGAHFLSDIMGGALISMAWSILLMRYAEPDACEPKPTE